MALRQVSPQSNVLFMRLAGGVFLGLGLLLISSGKLTTLTCNRANSTTSSCQLISSGLLGSLVKETRIIELRGAKVKDNPVDDDAYRVILLTKTGEVLFTSSDSGNDKYAKTVASNINAFVQEVKKNSLTIHHDERGLYLPMGGLIATFGLASLAFSGKTKFNLFNNSKGNR